jgi:insulysin
MMKKHRLPERYFGEEKELAEIDFRYREKPAPMGYAENMARRMLRPIPPSKLCASALLDTIDEDLTHKYLGYLNSDNFRYLPLDE